MRKRTHHCALCGKPTRQRVRAGVYGLRICRECMSHMGDVFKVAAESGVLMHCPKCGAMGSLRRNETNAKLIDASRQNVRPEDLLVVRVPCPDCA